MSLQSQIELRPCGNTGLELPVIGLGCWMLGGGEADYWGGFTGAEGDALITAALEMGVTYLDEAEMYNAGRSEEALGRILKGRREKAIIGTKINPLHANGDQIRTHCEASLRRLQTDYVDIYMVHWPIRDFPVAKAFEVLNKLREEGKIRVIGVSNFGVQDLSEALATGVPIGVNELHYNLLSRAIEVEILPLCKKHNVGVIGYMSLLQGVLSGKYSSIDEIPANRLRTRHFRGDRAMSRHGGPGAEPMVNSILARMKELSAQSGIPTEQLALGWCASKPGITNVLVGARTVEQLRSNLEGATRTIPADVLAELDAITLPLLEVLGSNADYWQSGAEQRIR